MILKKTLEFEVKESDELEEMTWYEAMEKFKDDTEGWRLPTKEELNLMYENKEKLNMVRFWYWSSSPIIDGYAWAQGFGGGFQDWYDRGSDGRVRCVRSVKDDTKTNIRI